MNEGRASCQGGMAPHGALQRRWSLLLQREGLLDSVKSAVCSNINLLMLKEEDDWADQHLPGALTGQSLTSPCQWLRIATEGACEGIRTAMRFVTAPVRVSYMGMISCSALLLFGVLVPRPSSMHLLPRPQRCGSCS